MKYGILLLFLSLTFCVQAQMAELTQARAAMAEEDFGKAAEIAQQGLSRYANNSPEYRGLIDVLLESKINLGELEEAGRINNDYLAVLTKNYGKEDTSLVTFIATKATLYYLDGYYTEAIEAYEQSLSILEKKGLTADRLYAELQNNVGSLYSQVGETAKAISSLDISRLYFEKQADQHVYELALLYNNLGDVYHNKYDYAKAAAYYDKALTNFDKLKDNASGDYLNTLGNYSTLLLDRGQQDLAIKTLLKNKTLAEQSVGKESPEYAVVLNNLGQAYKAKGNYRLAEEYLLEAYQVKAKLYKVEHPSRMLAGNNLAMFYYLLGQLDRSETMLQELIELNKQYHADDLSQLLVYTNNLSSVYCAQGKLSKAQQAAQDVMKLVEKTKGANSVDYFQAFNNYSVLLQEDDGKLELAYQNYAKMTSLYNSLKDQLPLEDVITYLTNKGTSAMYTNHHAEAIKDFQTGLALVEENYGKNHPNYYIFKANIGFDLTLQAKPQEAAAPLLENAQYQLQNVVDLFPSLTESEKEFYIDNTSGHLQHYYTFCIKNYVQLPTLVGELADLRLRSKSLVMRSLNETKTRIMNSGNATLIADYNKLTERKKEQAKYAGLSKRDLAKLGVNLEQEQQQTQVLEKQVAKNSEYLMTGMKATSWKAVAADLAPNEAAVEVIRITDDFYAKTRVVFYAFLILKKGQTQPELLVFNNGRALERKLFNFYRNNVIYKGEDNVSYALYWGEIAKKLTGINTVYLSTDGVYNKLNVNTLYNPETKKYVLDEINIILKGSLGKSIGAVSKPATDICLIGHPNYYLDLKEAIGNYAQGREPKARTLTTDAVVWNDLPGTKEEVTRIKDLLVKDGWKVTSLTEEAALENKVKNLQHPRIIHFATHGFFEESSGDSLSRYSQAYYIDPMLRSGLALSGAGVDFAPHELANSEYYEDGILYANEALSMNLTGTDCVVMSACETGLGDTRNQDGVYGLQRAFLIAGSNAVIMSLWSVDDLATKDLMVAFYTHYSKTKELDGAFRKAMTDIHLKYKEPYYWGAFVLMKK